MTTIGHETEELEFKKRLESLLNLVLFVLCSFFVLFWRAMRSSLAVGGHPTNATPLRSVCLYSFNVFCLPKTNKLPPGNFLPNSRSSIGCFPPKKDKAFCFVLFWRAMRSSLAVGGHPTNATPLRSVCLYSFNVFCLPKTNKLPPGNFLPNSRSSIGCFPPKKDKAFCFVLFWRAMRSSNPQPLVP